MLGCERIQCRKDSHSNAHGQRQSFQNRIEQFADRVAGGLFFILAAQQFIQRKAKDFCQ